MKKAKKNERAPNENLLTVIISMQVLLEAMDNIKGTSLYKHSLKQKINSVEKDLEEILRKGFDELYVEEEENFTIFIREVNNISTWVATAPYNDVIDLGDALNSGSLKFEEDE